MSLDARGKSETTVPLPEEIIQFALPTNSLCLNLFLIALVDKKLSFFCCCFYSFILQITFKKKMYVLTCILWNVTDNSLALARGGVGWGGVEGWIRTKFSIHLPQLAPQVTPIQSDHRSHGNERKNVPLQGTEYKRNEKPKKQTAAVTIKTRPGTYSQSRVQGFKLRLFSCLRRFCLALLEILIYIRISANVPVV